MKNSTSHGKFSDLLEVIDESKRSTCIALRNLIASIHKDAFEVAWLKQEIVSFGVGPKKMTEHYAYIGIQKSYVNLGFYHGATLRDPSGLLEGTGKKLRHIKIRSMETIGFPAIKALLKAAIADRFAALKT
jgi:hypothetical protein